MTRLRKEKVVAYITCADRLLFFHQPAFPEAGVQVPAGTMEAGENPREAVLREAQEETGLSDLQWVATLGQRDDVLENKHGEEMLLRRHFFHLRANGNPPQRWQHWEMTPSGGAEGPILFELWWAPLDRVRMLLDDWFAAFLDKVVPC